MKNLDDETITQGDKVFSVHLHNELDEDGAARILHNAAAWINAKVKRDPQETTLNKISNYTYQLIQKVDMWIDRGTSMENLLPILIIITSYGASAVYLYKGDLARAAYWFAAGTINTSTFWMK